MASLTLPESEFELVKNHLLALDLQCPICRNQKWNIMGAVAPLVFQEREGSAVVGPDVAPLFAVTCEVCLHTLFFARNRPLPKHAHPTISVSGPGTYGFFSTVRSIYDMTPEAADALKEAARYQFAVPAVEEAKREIRKAEEETKRAREETKRHAITSGSGVFIFCAALLGGIVGLDGYWRAVVVTALVTGAGLHYLLPRFRRRNPTEEGENKK